ncbi:hypothetical protein JTB14_019869 [Gonioctena quinquepunctata]|nr:hypothetical protein JTB14_019869 [Gonioctena quinquepunctata]
MGHGSQHGHSSKLGFGDTVEREKNPEDEVNEYLMKAIDARSIDRLRTEHCRTLLLNFWDPVKEANQPGTSVETALPDLEEQQLTSQEYEKFYVELEGNNEGVECLRLLDEIIADFDELLSEDQFEDIEKIKSTGATHMAASGLTQNACDMVDYKHVTAMADYAFRLKELLEEVNEHSFNHFRNRIGINVCPVVASVIRAKKSQYGIWGNAVNMASRMDTTGICDKIQITKEMNPILQNKGFSTKCRGAIEVKEDEVNKHKPATQKTTENGQQQLEEAQVDNPNTMLVQSGIQTDEYDNKANGERMESPIQRNDTEPE